MKTKHLMVAGLISTLTTVSIPAVADADQDCGWMPHHYGHMSFMGGGGGPWMMHGGQMMGSGGPGWMMGMNPDILNDEYLDRIGERISEHVRLMQSIASEEDKSARRELVRQQMKSMHAYRWDRQGDEEADEPTRRGYGYGSMMGRGAMMGPGMMMHPDRLSDDYLDDIGERMAENYARMQELAATTDKAKRRELVREHLEAMRRF